MSLAEVDLPYRGRRGRQGGESFGVEGRRSGSSCRGHGGRAQDH